MKQYERRKYSLNYNKFISKRVYRKYLMGGIVRDKSNKKQSVENPIKKSTKMIFAGGIMVRASDVVSGKVFKSGGYYYVVVRLRNKSELSSKEYKNEDEAFNVLASITVQCNSNKS